jgi:hypothetical protein
MASGESEPLQAPGDSASAPAAAPSPALPPPEKRSAIRQRSYVVLSFWLVVLLLGVPIWWKTTAIYRADLPLDNMLKWADGKVWPFDAPRQCLCRILADFTWLIGLSTRLSPSDFDTGRFPARPGSAESHPTNPACAGRPE